MRKLGCAAYFAFATVCLLSWCSDGAPFIFDQEKNLSEVGRSYFAPTTMHDWRCRLPDRVLREFHYETRDGLAVYVTSPDGWKGRVMDSRAEIVPSNRDCRSDAVQKYCFENGRLVSLFQKDMRRLFKYPEILPNPGEVLPPLWKGADEIDPSKANCHDIWRGSGRLRGMYRNPNSFATLLAELAVLAFALFLGSGKFGRIHGALVLLNLLVLLTMTKSRGALLGLGVAFAFLVLARGRGVWRVSKKKAAGLVLLLLVLAAVVFVGYRDRFVNLASTRLSDEIRFEAWDRVPEMMSTAPWGWNYPFAGMVYVNWFQDLDRYLSVKDMMNEHLTFLVMHGLPLRAIYLFAFLFAFSVLMAEGLRKRNACAFGTFAVYAITASLNRTYENPSLALIPIAGLLWTVLVCVRERGISGLRRYSLFAGVLTVALLLGVQVTGAIRSARKRPSIHCDGTHVLVGGRQPTHWIVDDGTVLNAHYVGKEIRGFYAENPFAPPVGYVQILDDLPRGVRQVTVFGRACATFVDRCRHDPTAFDCAKVKFVSPTLAPSDIPDDIRSRFGIEVYLGVFLAQTLTDDGRFPSWVHVVPATERYLPGWMRFCVN